MNNNINHVNFFTGTAKSEPVKAETAPAVTEPKDDIEVIELDVTTREGLFDLVKSEQIEILQNLGLTSKEIRELNTEAKRVDKILSFVGK